MPSAPTVYLLQDAAQSLEKIRQVARRIGLDGTWIRPADISGELERPCCMMIPHDGDMDTATSIGRGIRKHHEYAPPLVFLTTAASFADSIELMLLGAFVVLPIDGPHDDVTGAIRKAIVLDRRNWKEARRLSYLRSMRSSLLSREMEVAELIVAGKSNHDVARRIDVSVRTVESRRSRIFQKFGVDSIAQFASAWTELNLRERWLYQNRIGGAVKPSATGLPNREYSDLEREE